MRRRRGWLLPSVLAVTLLVAGGGLWLGQDHLRSMLGEDPRVDTGELLPRVAPTPTPVLADPTPSQTVAPAALAARLSAVPRGKLSDVGAVVLDATTGEALYTSDDSPQAPASTMKLLSSLVALDVLGPDTTFTTRVVRGEGSQLVLVGGGDPLLTSAASDDDPDAASLERLAAATAAALKESGTTSVALGYDASLFGQPAWNPEWPETFQWSVAPITALTADHARPNLADPARVTDPAAFAAGKFAGWLKTQGVEVTSTAVAAAPAEAATLASVVSPPVSTIVEHTLLASDNDAAETLAWHVSLARGRTATFADSAAVLTSELQARGLWTEGMHIVDGSGISANNRVAPSVLARAVTRGLADARLRALVTGLPAAGVTGTLDDRFTAPAAQPGRGVVRAKTGTIRGVHALAGFVVTRDGQPLAFAFVLNDAVGSAAPRAWIDEAASVLASCGCAA